MEGILTRFALLTASLRFGIHVRDYEDTKIVFDRKVWGSQKQA